MEKLPKKEDLLPRLAPPPQAQTRGGEHSDVLQAKEAADIAEAQLKQSTAEAKRRLLERGYQTLEEGVSDIQKKQGEAQHLLDLVRKDAESLEREKETFEQEKQKMVRLVQVIKEKESAVSTKLEQAVLLEENARADADNYQAMREELIELAVYHKLNIAPCRKALLQISRAIYAWADVLSQSNLNVTALYNFIGAKMRTIDNYLDHAKVGASQSSAHSLSLPEGEGPLKQSHKQPQPYSSNRTEEQI